MIANICRLLSSLNCVFSFKLAPDRDGKTFDKFFAVKAFRIRNRVYVACRVKPYRKTSILRAPITL